MTSIQTTPASSRIGAAPRVSRRTVPDWAIATGLLLLSIIPAFAGSARIVEITTGATVTADNARFIASPIPITLHIVGSIVYAVLGAFQFLPGLRRRRPVWHRAAGWILFPAGVVSALSGIWMTLFYPWVGFDGEAVSVVRLLAGGGMFLSLCLGVVTAARHDIAGHRAWMMRAYAIGIAAGTQVITHLPWFLFPDIRGELARAICMTAGWVLNVAVAELLIARSEARSPRTETPMAIATDERSNTRNAAGAGDVSATVEIIR